MSDDVDASDTTGPARSGAPTDPVDLTAIERDLDGVEHALRRLDEGTYWTDEITGEPIPDQVLTDDPVARRTGNATSG